MFDHLSDAAVRVRTAAFGALFAARVPTIAEVAAAARLSVPDAMAALDELVVRGLAQHDGDGLVTGAHGLTVGPTRHRLVVGETTLYTWCAIDAIGIPAALDRDATAFTTCPWCNKEIEVRISAGTAPAEPYMLWAPEMTSVVVVEEFCPHANLFCDREHLEAWLERAEGPAGTALTLPEVADFGRDVWADVRPSAG